MGGHKLLETARGFAFPTLVLLLVIVPFVLFGDSMESASASLAERTGLFGYGVVMALLLAADILLPVPASIVSTASVLALGPVAGGLVVFLGMTAGCVLGHYLGRKGGAPLARALGGEHNHEQLRRFVDRWGWLGLVLMRPLPVLAEASVMIAGSAGVSLPAVLLAVVPANLVVAIAYAVAASFIGSEAGLPVLITMVVVLAAAFTLARKLWPAEANQVKP